MKVISRNYLDRTAPQKWLVRDETDAPGQGTPCQAVIARNVRFQKASKAEEDLGCAMVAVSEDVEVLEHIDPQAWAEGEVLCFYLSGIYNVHGARLQQVQRLMLSRGGEIQGVI